MMMKSSTFQNLDQSQHYYNKRNRWLNTRRFVSFLLWLIFVVSIFIFFLVYYPTPNRFMTMLHDTPPKFMNDPQLLAYYFPKTSARTHNQSHNEEKYCDLFKGHWIPDLKGSLYTNWSCPNMMESKNCRKYGRKDVDYMNWRWKPDECELPRFDPKIFFSVVRGRKMAFIGDSVARNHMESLLCLLSQEEIPKDIYKDSEDRFRTLYFPSHDFTLMVLWDKFLVVADERVKDPGVFDIHLDKININWAEKLRELDYAIISAGHWLFRKNYLHKGGKLIGCIYCDEPNVTKVDIPFATGKIFKSVLEFIDGCQDCKSSLVTVLRTFAPAHFEGGSWNGGGYCNRTSPYTEEQVKMEGAELKTDQVKQLERIKKKEANKIGKKRFEVLDITRAMMMRPDGHPGIHWNNKYMHGYSDCVHWCLPGPIDVWNDLLMAVLRRKDGSSLHRVI